MDDVTQVPDEMFPMIGRDPEQDDDQDESARTAVLTLRLLNDSNRLGFDLGPYNLATTGLQIRSDMQGMLLHHLRIGALLYRVRLTEGVTKFWAWFDGQQFPMSRDAARRAILATRQVLDDPKLAAIARNLQSVKAFQIVARRLSLPEGQAELANSGTVMGLKPENLSGSSIRDLADLKKRVEEAERKQKAAEQEAAALRVASESGTRERDKLRLEILKHTNPDLNVSEIRTSWRREASEARAQAAAGISRYRCSIRRDLDALGEEEALIGWADLLLLRKLVDARLAEWELKFGKLAPAILLDEEGNPRTPMTRVSLRVMEEQIPDDYDAISALERGRPVTVIDNATGVILGSVGQK